MRPELEGEEGPEPGVRQLMERETAVGVPAATPRCAGALGSAPEALKTVVVTARYFMSLCGSRKPESESTFKGRKEIFELKETRQHALLCSWRFWSYHHAFLERTGRGHCRWRHLSLVSMGIHVPNHDREKPLHPLFDPVLLWLWGTDWGLSHLNTFAACTKGGGRQRLPKTHWS